MKTILEIENKIKELDLMYKEIREGKRTSELTVKEFETVVDISKQSESLSEELYEMFNTNATTILDGINSVRILDDGKEKFMAVLSDEYGALMHYKRITDDQYNSFV
jgi:hypothetical protein